MELRAVLNNVIVKRTEAASSSGSIILTHTDKEKINQGEVLVVGPGLRNSDGSNQAMELKVGDKIMFPESVGKEIKSNGEKYLIIKETDVLGILED